LKPSLLAVALAGRKIARVPVFATGRVEYNRPMLPQRQLDLFAAGGLSAPAAVPAPAQRSPPLAPDLDDDALIAAIPNAGPANCRDLADEAARRHLVGAVAALEALCRRFKGFGLQHAVPEQMVGMRAITAIGGHEAAQAITRIIVDQAAQGPGLAAAINAAARLGCRLPAATSLPLLRHADPAVRADAARCARLDAEVIDVLIDLLGDLHDTVALAAACALGRMGRIEARPMLLRLLQAQPSAEVIDAVSFVADEDCVVVLGRIARTRQDVAADAMRALEQIDDERAASILAAIRKTADR
jgi:hypothetical protein